MPIKVYGWYRASLPKVLVTHYRSKRPGLTHESSIGSILVDPSAAPSEIVSFQRCLREELEEWNGRTVAPLNGHTSLGYALPAPQVDWEEIGFQNSSQSLLLQSFFSEGAAFRVSKQFDFGVNELRGNDNLALPRYLSTRPVSPVRFKRDISIYNQLLNRCMQGSEDFFPLTFEEEWEIMKHSWPLIVPEYFQFLVLQRRRDRLLFCSPRLQRGF